MDEQEPIYENIEEKKFNTKQALIVFTLFALIFVIIFIVLSNNKREPIVDIEEVSKPTIGDVFRKYDIEAEAYAIYDVLDNKMLIGRNPELQLPLASISKIMTAYIASSYIDNGNIITINDKDLKIEGDSGLLLDEKWRFSDLRDFTLVVSSNDGANSLASAVDAIQKDKKITFTDLMNAKAKEFGLRQTYFLNSSGLDIDEETQSGSYGSARDMAILFSRVLLDKPNILEATTEKAFETKSLDDITHTAKNTNQIVETVPGILGSKTGFTDLAGGNLVIAFDAGLMQPYVISILGSSKDGRFEDVLKLHNAVLEYIHL